MRHPVGRAPEVLLLTLVLVGLIGGLITGISPCVLPVLPAVFLAGGVGAPVAATGRGEPVNPGGLGVDSAGRAHDAADRRRPYLVVAGLALSFSVFTLLGSLALRALHLPQDVIRWAGLGVLLVLGIGLIVPRFEALLERPFARIPQLRTRPGAAGRGGFVLGLALGAVYVPCAGPVLAAITVAGATGKINTTTVVLTLTFAVGTAIPLLAFALAGRRITERIAVFRRHQRRLRVGAGVVVIALAVALTFNVTDALQRAIPDYTADLNTALTKAAPLPAPASGDTGNGQLGLCAQDLRAVLLGCGPAPDITGISQWFNTPGDAPLSLPSLRGKVVLVDFWAYSCINCQRAIPHLNAWYAAYAASGLEVVGVHTPEYAFEHVAGNVQAGASRLGIKYPVALDNDYGTWNAYANTSWPAEYLIDATGQVRHVAIGEGNYLAMEELIRSLLQSAHPGATLPRATLVDDTTPSGSQTPETYLGVGSVQNFAGSPAMPSLLAGNHSYAPPASVPDDEFALAGEWTADDESITAGPGATITLDFDASDVYLDVGGTGTVHVVVDGKAGDHQVSGVPDIRQIYGAGPAATENDAPKPIRHVMTVTLSPGLTAYSFTFG